MAWHPTRTISKAVLASKLIILVLRLCVQKFGDFVTVRSRRYLSPSVALGKDSKLQNIVIVGASYAGYHAARIIADMLPPDAPYRVIVIEPHSHFQFTWVFPRFCVVDGAHKAFIPYGPYLKSATRHRVRWMQDRVAKVGRDTIQLAGRGEEIPYAFLAICTGSEAPGGLPSRVGADGKEEGVARLKAMQESVQNAEKLVIVGGGAAGVELAADVKQKYPEKSVTLVHSRDAVMHRFGPELRAAATGALTSLGVALLLGERTKSNDITGGFVTLTSGRAVACDLLINCTGQRPASAIVAALSPEAISATGHIRVKESLQIQDDSLPNVYVCGDVADISVPNPNSRFAMNQATVVAKNIVRAAMGDNSLEKYAPLWADSLIKLTLGLSTSVVHLSDGKTEILWHTKEKNESLMSADAWKLLGLTPFEDAGVAFTTA